MILRTLQFDLSLIASSVRQVWGRFDHKRPEFDSSDMWTLVSIAALLIATAVITYRSSQRRKQEFTHDSPRRLFRELCRAHRLTLSSQRLLKRLVAAHGVQNAATSFVDSTYFDAPGLPKNLQPAADQIRMLRDQLFD